MTRAFTTLAFSPSVRAAQTATARATAWSSLRRASRTVRALPDEMQDRLRRANSIIIGTASREGWPHVQHRGGPRGFIKVLAPDELAFADYSGNRQYISVGNLAENDRMFLLLLDYAERTRLKIWGRGEAIDDDPALLERVRDPDYPARVERVIRMRVEAWDTNCNSHIPLLVPEADAQWLNRHRRRRVPATDRRISASSSGWRWGRRSDSASAGSPMHCCCRRCGSISAGAMRRPAR